MKSELLFTAFDKRHCGKVAFFHRGGYTADTAFELTDEIRIKLSLPRLIGATGATIEVFSEFTQVIRVSGEWSGLSFGLDEYEFSFLASEIGVGLFFVRFCVEGKFGKLYGSRCGEKIVFDFPRKSDNLNQITVSSFEYSSPTSIYGGVIYHIFVDRFCRGNERKLSDGSVWGDFSNGIPEFPQYPGAPLKNNTFYGGTLDGILSKLDYIKSLGVNALYLSPIFESPSNHKYDTGDYMAVDPGFGGDASLERLIVAAREHKIKIILDGVFNHTGSNSLYFNKNLRYNSIGAYQSKDSKYYSWYDFSEHPDKYTSWWGIDILPRINPDVPECRDYFVGDGGVVDKYRVMGIYGFRLDVADELSDDFISEIKKKLDSYGESVLYGEVWEDASNKIAYGKRKKYFLGKELDGVMNYPLRCAIIDYITKKDVTLMKYALDDVMYNAPKRIRDAQMNLLGSHDTVRIITALAGESSEGYTNEQLSKKRMTYGERELGVRRLIAAYTVLATLPGIPTIYYGDEVGLEGYSDPFNRMPFPWGKEEMRLLTHYRKIGNLRKKNDVYIDGDFKLNLLNGNMLVFSRFKGNERYVTAYNNADFPIDISFQSDVKSLLENSDFKNFTLYPCEAQVFLTHAKNTLIVKYNR